MNSETLQIQLYEGQRFCKLPSYEFALNNKYIYLRIKGNDTQNANIRENQQ